MKRLTISDSQNTPVRNTAERLIFGKENLSEKVEAIFYFVRDDIKFGFLKEGDLIPASEIIKKKIGQCNNKSALFHALCQAVGIKSQIHFSGITKDIQRGLFTGLMYKLMPNEISHSWVEVEINGNWVLIDSFINDLKFYTGGKEKLKELNWDTGFSVSCKTNDSSADFNIDNPQFVQMDAVSDDHGVFTEPMDYYLSDKYNNRPSKFKLMVYRMAIGGINKKIKGLRESGATSLCSTCND